MKRVLALTLGASLAAFSAAPAEAASHIDFSGYYRVTFFNSTNLGHHSEPRSFTDSFFMDRFNIDLAFHPTDEVSVFWRLRGPDHTYDNNRWGSGRAPQMNTMFVYGRVVQDWGTVYVGRLNDAFDNFGLATLGRSGLWDPYFYIKTSPFDDGRYLSGALYTNTWDNGFTLKALYSRLNDPGSSDADYRFLSSDRTSDHYLAEGSYKWDGGGASLGAWYDRNATFDDNPASTAGLARGLDKITMAYVNPALMHSWGDFSFHLEGLLGWGKSEYVKGIKDIDREGQAVYLDFEYNYGPGYTTLMGWWASGTSLNDDPNDHDNKNKSAVNMGKGMRPLLVAGQAAIHSWSRIDAVGGFPSGANNWEQQDAVGIANNGYANFVRDAYRPIGMPANSTIGFLSGGAAALAANLDGAWTNDATLYSFQDALRDSAIAGSIVSRERTTSFNNTTAANNWGITLIGKHSFTPEITMNYAVGYLALNNPNYRVVDRAHWNSLDTTANTRGTITSVGYTEQSKDLGWEADLGVTIQLLDNLKFTSMFGYMFNGDAYKSLKGFRYTEAVPSTSGNIKAVWEDADDSYTWYNVLQMDF